MKQKRVGFSKLSEFRRQEAVKGRRESAMLSQLTPTQIALLFPDYFKRGTPDIGGFREAISRATAEQQQQLLKTLSDKTGVDPSTGKDFGSIPASGNLKQNQQEAYKAARAEGLSDKAARALVANMSGEGLANPGAFNRDYNSRGEFVHMARGIVQWDPPRSEAIKRNFGKYPNEMTVAEQTKAAIWEMKTNPNYAPTWAALNDPNASSQDMVEKLVRNYERSAHQDADIERRMGYLGGLKVDESGTATVDRTQQGATPPTGGAGQTATPSVQAEGQAPSAEVSYENRGGYLAPKNRNMYSAGNVEQCATLTKAFADVGRSSSWKVERVDPGMIKPGTPIASLKYNEDGPDKTNAGYHTGIALTSPNEKGDVMILHQWGGRNPSGGAKIGWVNINSYHNGETSFGLIRSNGTLHTEQSMEALKYASQIATPEQKKLIETNMNNASEGKSPVSGSPSEQTAGPQAPPGAEGMPMGGQAGPTADLMQPMQMMQNLMGMAMGGQSADPIGLIMPVMNMIMPMLGGGVEAIAGPLTTGIMQGEGIGGPGGPTVLPKINVNRARRGAGRKVTQPVSTQEEQSPITGEGTSAGSKLLSFISKGEGTYKAINQGTIGKRTIGSTLDSTKVIGKDITQMSVGEIMEMQKGTLKTGRKLFAVGRYQIIPKTMVEAMKTAGVSKDDVFDEKTQDKLGMALLTGGKRPRLAAYLKGKSNDLHGAMVDFAQEWRSIPHPDTGRAVGGGPNKAHHSVESVKQALMSARTEFANRKVEPTTQLADVSPAVRAGKVGPTTPATPEMQAPSQKALFDLMSSRRGQAETSQVTPAASTNIPRTPTTPGSMSLSAQPAPQTPISKQVRNPLGIYSRPSSRDMMYGFAKGEDVSKTQLEGVTNVGRATPASTTPDSNTTQTATPVTPSQRQLRNLPTFAKFDTSNMASVSPYVGVGATPGPVPDRTSGQMAQIRDQMRTISEMATSQAGKERQMPQEAPSKVEHTPAIPVPPSYERAVGRSHQEENKTRAADNVHSYGNYRE